MGKYKLPRMNGERLRQAIKDKGYKQNQFGALYKEDEIYGGIFINRLCLEDDNPNKQGADLNTIKDMARRLGVLPEWLLGETDYRTREDQLEAIRAREYSRNKQIHSITRTTQINLKKSPIFNLIADRLDNHQVKTDADGGSWIMFSFGDEEYMISADELSIIENVCADLCCSLIKNNSIPKDVQPHIIEQSVFGNIPFFIREPEDNL